MKEKIVQLLGAGIPQNVIAQTVGCDPSYISQLLEQETIQAEVANLRMGRAAALVEHDSSIGELEKQALEKMERLLPMQTDLMKVTKVFQVLNSARRASDVGAAQNAGQPGTVVNLNLPPAAHIHFKMTSDQQVIEIEGRSMVPMPSHMVAAKLREVKAERLLTATQEAVKTITTRTKSIVDQL